MLSGFGSIQATFGYNTICLHVRINIFFYF